MARADPSPAFHRWQDRDARHQQAREQLSAKPAHPWCRAAMPHLAAKPTRVGACCSGCWACAHPNVVVVAFAAKLARVVWAVLRHEKPFRSGTSTCADPRAAARRPDAARGVCVGENRWHNGRTGGSEILVLNVVHGAGAFMRTRDARISILARVRPETGYVDADRHRQLNHACRRGGPYVFERQPSSFNVCQISPTLAATWCVANSHVRSSAIVVSPRSATYARIAA